MGQIVTEIVCLSSPECVRNAGESASVVTFMTRLNVLGTIATLPRLTSASATQVNCVER